MTNPYWGQPASPGFGTGQGSDVNRLHDYDDVDTTTLSHHHTLGILPGQSSPGDHLHDARTSKRLAITSINEYGAGSWTPTPFGAILALGGLTASGRYQRIGRMINIQTKITFSATTTYTANAMQIPLVPAYPLRSSSLDTVLLARLLDVSAGQGYWGGAIIDPNQSFTSVFRISFGGPSGSMTSAVPIALASGDILHISGSYETNG